MDNCLFCKIIALDVPSYKIYEDESILVILDLFPVNFGQCLVLPKVHYTSKFSQVDESFFLDFMHKVQLVARYLEEKLDNVERCQLVFEGFHVDHLHAKLYPAYLPNPSKDGVIHEGKKASDSELEALQQKLQTNSI